MEQLERNGVNEARYAALELLEAELRDGNRAHAELAREELRDLRAAGALRLGSGEGRFWCEGLSRCAVRALEEPLEPEDPAESGLWAPVELDDVVTAKAS